MFFAFLKGFLSITRNREQIRYKNKSHAEQTICILEYFYTFCHICATFRLSSSTVNQSHAYMTNKYTLSLLIKSTARFTAT